jgi:hypothetical protein
MVIGVAVLNRVVQGQRDVRIQLQHQLQVQVQRVRMMMVIKKRQIVKKNHVT